MITVAKEVPSFARRHTDQSNRLDIYRLAHKGLRACLADTMNRVGKVDASDPQDVADATAQVRDMLDLCRTHLEVEEGFLHSALEARQPGSSRQTARDHVDHHKAFIELDAALKEVDQADTQDLPVATHRLYQKLALFVADNYKHMHVEESENNSVLWKHYNDDELLDIQKSLVVAIPASQMSVFQRWMIPAMAPFERAGMLAAAKRGATAQEFAATLNRVKPYLATAEWNKLVAALAGV